MLIERPRYMQSSARARVGGRGVRHSCRRRGRFSGERWARADSDVDIVLVVTDPGRYFLSLDWINRFGDIVLFEMKIALEAVSLHLRLRDTVPLRVG